MLEQVVRLTVGATVNEGQRELFERIAQAMTDGSKAEPGTLGYEWFTNGDRTSYRLVETYVDAAAVEAHFAGPVVQELVPQLMGACTLNSIEFYGDPGPKVSSAVSALGAGMFQYWTGINR